MSHSYDCKVTCHLTCGNDSTGIPDLCSVQNLPVCSIYPPIGLRCNTYRFLLHCLVSIFIDAIFYILRLNYMKCIGVYFIISVDRLQLNINIDSTLYENSSLLGHYAMSAGKQVSIYQSTWCNVTEAFHLHQHYCENFKFCIAVCVGRTDVGIVMRYNSSDNMETMNCRRLGDLLQISLFFNPRSSAEF
jgi:hypothetical protein